MNKVLFMTNIDFLLQKNDLAFSNRELALLTGFSRKKIWQLMTRLQKYDITQIKTKKMVTYWQIIDFDNFKSEIERLIE